MCGQFAVCHVIQCLFLLTGACDLEPCLMRFEAAQAQLGVRDEFPLSVDVSASSTLNEQRCMLRRTFYVCVKNRSRTCWRDLSYRTAKRLLEGEMKKLDCNVSGPVVDVGDGPRLRSNDDAPGVCTHQHNNSFALCSLYGDPHLRTFDGQFATCRSEGAWPLLDNEFVTVQVTNRQHAEERESATVVSEICSYFSSSRLLLSEVRALVTNLPLPLMLCHFLLIRHAPALVIGKTEIEIRVCRIKIVHKS